MGHAPMRALELVHQHKVVRCAPCSPSLRVASTSTRSQTPCSRRWLLFRSTSQHGLASWSRWTLAAHRSWCKHIMAHSSPPAGPCNPAACSHIRDIPCTRDKAAVLLAPSLLRIAARMLSKSTARAEANVVASTCTIKLHSADSHTCFPASCLPHACAVTGWREDGLFGERCKETRSSSSRSSPSSKCDTSTAARDTTASAASCSAAPDTSALSRRTPTEQSITHQHTYVPAPVSHSRTYHGQGRGH